MEGQERAAEPVFPPHDVLAGVSLYFEFGHQHGVIQARMPAHAAPDHLAAAASGELFSYPWTLLADVAHRGRARIRSARHGGPRIRGACSRFRVLFSNHHVDPRAPRTSADMRRLREEANKWTASTLRKLQDGAALRERLVLLALSSSLTQVDCRDKCQSAI